MSNKTRKLAIVNGMVLKKRKKIILPILHKKIIKADLKLRA